MARDAELHLVTDRKRARGDLIQAVAAALRGGVDAVQVREKRATALDTFTTTRALIPLARTAGARVLVNDRVDVALAAGADGVHLAARSLPPAIARPMLPGRLLGVSVHSVQAARAAVADGADYVTFGHVFPTASHPGQPPRGVAELGAVVAAIDVPVLAIGGITAANVGDVLSTGCAGVAIISAILDSADPERAARELRAAIDASATSARGPLPLA